MAAQVSVAHWTDKGGELSGDLNARAVPESRFRAFVSYSHADKTAAQRLHRKLESYRLPKHLRDAASNVASDGRVGAIFRDREDLPAAQDLTESVKEALSVSEALVVLCSPAAKASPWVAREIELFRELHPDRPILAALIRGEPDEAFPEPLRAGGEPLAADLRKEGDGPRLGFLKVVAGIARVPLDALINRDAQRRVRRVTAITVAAIAAMVVMALMTTFAFHSRDEAQYQRAEAEDVIEFMMTDLRKDLRGVGRLDVMKTVNARAAEFYDRQGDMDELPADSALRWSRILHAEGEDLLSIDQRDAALASFRKAHAVTSGLLRRDPDDAASLYTHAQSAYWVGAAHFEMGKVAAAMPHFEQYREVAYRLLDAEPEADRSKREVGFAEGNLCAMALQKPDRAKDALASCRKATRQIESLYSGDTQNTQLKSELANRYAWDADASLAAGDGDQAVLLRLKQLKLIEEAITIEPESAELQQNLMLAELSLGELYSKINNVSAATDMAARAQLKAERLKRLDPDNAKWRIWSRRIKKLVNDLKGE